MNIASRKSLAPDLSLFRLGQGDTGAAGEARRFCLGVIREFYGFDYRPDWHADLDSLLLDAENNHFGGRHDGAFWLVRDTDGAIVATAGVRHLGWKPNCMALFRDRYGSDGRAIASLWRLYVRKDHRGRGLGTWMSHLCEDEAIRLGYRRMYLHASADAVATIGFWKTRGYALLSDDGETAHFDKPLGG